MVIEVHVVLSLGEDPGNFPMEFVVLCQLPELLFILLDVVKSFHHLILNQIILFVLPLDNRRNPLFVDNGVDVLLVVIYLGARVLLVQFGVQELRDVQRVPLLDKKCGIAGRVVPFCLTGVVSARQGDGECFLSRRGEGSAVVGLPAIVSFEINTFQDVVLIIHFWLEFLRFCGILVIFAM